MLPVDVTDADALARVVGELPRVDSIVFLAGEYTPMPLDALDLQKCRAIVETNVMGTLNLIHAVLPILLRQSGQIALCASVAGYRGLGRGQPYSATKAALINIAESLKIETRGKKY